MKGMSVLPGNICRMIEIVWSVVGVSVGATVSAWVGYSFGVRRERDAERRVRDLEAAASLVTPLRELQRLLRTHGRVAVTEAEVAAAFLAWGRACDEHLHRLPLQWRRVARSVRDAAGTVFGGVSLIHVRPDTEYLELGEPDEMWQDFADDYIDYIAASILTWGDSNREASEQVLGYDDWLIKTERREPLSRRLSRQSNT